MRCSHQRACGLLDTQLISLSATCTSHVTLLPPDLPGRAAVAACVCVLLVLQAQAALPPVARSLMPATSSFPWMNQMLLVACGKIWRQHWWQIQRGRS